MVKMKKIDKITAIQIKANGIQSLSKRPNESMQYGACGLSAEELKLRFDKLASLLADKINEIITALSENDALSVPTTVGAAICQLWKVVSVDEEGMPIAWKPVNMTDAKTLILETIQSELDAIADEIQELIETKAESSISCSATLSASQWTGTQAPYSQQVTVSGISADQNGFVSISQSATAAQREAAREAMLSVTGQASGVLTVSADGDKPSVDIPISITLFG